MKGGWQGVGVERPFLTPISLWRVLCEWKAVATAPLLLPSSPDLSLHQHCCSESAKVAQSLPRCLGCCQGCNRTYNCASLGLLKLYAMRAHADDDQAYTRCGMWYAMPASTRAGMWYVYATRSSTCAGMDAALLMVHCQSSSIPPAPR